MTDANYNVPSAPAGDWSITLHSTEGGSDKLYIVTVQSEGEGYIVRFQNGRRGGTMAGGAKTPSPVDYAAAKKVADKLIAEKMKKGYNPISVGSEAVEYVAPTDSGHRPQLLAPIELKNALPSVAGLPFLTNDRYAAQEKHDGERRMVLVSEDDVVGINRLGQTVSLPVALKEALKAADSGLYDGELVGDKLYVFDALELKGQDLRALSFEDRVLKMAEGLQWVNAPALFEISKIYSSTAAKSDFIGQLQRVGAEGIVFKLKSAPYSPGARDETAMKLKFWKSLSAIVGPANAQRSVQMGLMVNGQCINVGNVTIPPNSPVPAEGSVIEVRYLYAYPQGSLYQPTFLGVRTDIAPEECLGSQREFKQTEAPRSSAPGLGM